MYKALLSAILFSSPSNARAILNETNDLMDAARQQQPVRFFILDSFKPETISFFNSCSDELKSKHFGAKYFTKKRLEVHEWYNSTATIEDSEVLIVPFQFTMAIRGKCGQSSNVHTARKEIAKAIQSVIDLGEQIKGKAILFHLHDWRFSYDCYHDPRLPNLFKKLSKTHAHFYVAHYEDKPNWTCPWKIASQGHNTIVVPYTIPISSDQYQDFNEGNEFFNWSKRQFSFFFMGSVCKPGHAHHYFHRSVAIKYLDQLNANNVTKTFGVVTDGYKHQKKKGKNLCASSGIYDLFKPCVADWNASRYPCYIMDKEVNKDNKLYIDGMKNSKFNLMMHGDSPTSGKFYDSIAFNMINVMVGITKQNTKHFLPFADVVPYENFLFFIEPRDFEKNGYELLKNIIHNTTDDIYQNMMGNLTLYKKHILWNMRGSVVVNEVLRQVVKKESN